MHILIRDLKLFTLLDSAAVHEEGGGKWSFFGKCLQVLGVAAGVQLAVLPPGLVSPALHSAATLLSLFAGGEDVLMENLVCTRKRQP